MIAFRASLLVALASCAFAGYASPLYGYSARVAVHHAAPVYGRVVAPAVTAVHHGAAVSHVSSVSSYRSQHPVATPVARYASVHTAPAVATVHTVPAVAKVAAYAASAVHAVPTHGYGFGYGYGLGTYGLRYGHGLSSYGYGLAGHGTRVLKILRAEWQRQARIYRSLLWTVLQDPSKPRSDNRRLREFLIIVDLPTYRGNSVDLPRSFFGSCRYSGFAAPYPRSVLWLLETSRP
ncbi:hypothetical protein HPB47_024444 [Ixodes persulcatus]|uniref:Uncharacterized protein n=1 Tax=Ixodes persulcatus TaxID=34615 RepID=A0AC60Q4V1_IXOPE|nr:hypothetical protein HPB47_024444 [Ixodes persulcatus]